MRLLYLSLWAVATAAGAQATLACPPIQGDPKAARNTKLPDPFTFFNGTKVTTVEQWDCRRRELSQVLQRQQYGIIPGPPDSLETAWTAPSNLSIVIKHQNKTISFLANVTLPANATGPSLYPAIVGVGAIAIPVPAGVATVIFDQRALAKGYPSSEGPGKFFDLYGRNYDIGSVGAWAWATSRLIDALEKTPALGIDTKRLAVTSCSQGSRGALAAGAFDERVAVTIPQESGLGGVASWRVSYLAGRNRKGWDPIESPAEGPPGDFRREFYGRYDILDRPRGEKVLAMPFDQHDVMALVAPRALLVPDSSIDWLEPMASYVTAGAAWRVWRAMGLLERLAFLQPGNHAHCKFPEDYAARQIYDLFMRKFLLREDGVEGQTGILLSSLFRVGRENEFIDWETPVF